MPTTSARGKKSASWVRAGIAEGSGVTATPGAPRTTHSIVAGCRTRPPGAEPSPSHTRRSASRSGTVEYSPCPPMSSSGTSGGETFAGTIEPSRWRRYTGARRALIEPGMSNEVDRMSHGA